jgi:DNA-binding GntR family transcriptional regulator
VSALQAAMDSMTASARTGDLEGLIDGDLLFHLELCNLSGNHFLVEHARRLLLPLFAFVRMRVSASGQSPSAWDRDLVAHQKIIDLITEGEGDVAEHYVRRAMDRFAQTAYDNWEKREANGK